jgi:hypothetical protein
MVFSHRKRGRRGTCRSETTNTETQPIRRALPCAMPVITAQLRRSHRTRPLDTARNTTGSIGALRSDAICYRVIAVRILYSIPETDRARQSTSGIAAEMSAAAAADALLRSRTQSFEKELACRMRDPMGTARALSRG